MIIKRQQTISNKSEIINASEIGQYFFCPVAWYLKRCGYRPKSYFIEKGNNKHKEIGKILYQTQLYSKKHRILDLLGYILIIIAIIIIIKVIL